MSLASMSSGSSSIQRRARSRPAEPGLRLRELAREAVGAAELDVGLQQPATRPGPGRLGPRDQLGEARGGAEVALGQLESPVRQGQLAQPEVRPAEAFRGRHVDGPGGRRAARPGGGPARTARAPSRAGRCRRRSPRASGGRPPGSGRGRRLGAAGDLAEAGDRLVEQGPPQRTGRGRLAELLLDVVDEPIEGLQGEVALLDGGPGVAAVARGRATAEPRRCGRSRRRSAGRRPWTAVARLVAMPGCRRAHFHARSPAEAGRARIGRPSRNRRRSSARASARRRTAARAPSPGTSGRSSPGRGACAAGAATGGTGSLVVDLLERRQRGRAPERRPAGQHLVEDRPQRVDVGRRADPPGRPVAPAPGPCSWACPGSRRRRVRPWSPSSSFARPKSATLGVPSSASRTLAGLRSRWTIPRRWA